MLTRKVYSDKSGFKSLFTLSLWTNYREKWRADWPMNLIVSSIVGCVNEQIAL